MKDAFPRGQTAIVSAATYGVGAAPGYSTFDLAALASVDVAHVLDSRIAREDVTVVRHRLHQQRQRLDGLQDLLFAGSDARLHPQAHMPSSASP